MAKGLNLACVCDQWGLTAGGTYCRKRAAGHSKGRQLLHWDWLLKPQTTDPKSFALFVRAFSATAGRPLLVRVVASEPVNTLLCNPLLCNLQVERAKGSDAGTTSCSKRAAGPSQGGERVESCLCLRSVGSDGRRHLLPQASRRTFQRPPTFALGLALKAANHRPEKILLCLSEHSARQLAARC